MTSVRKIAYEELSLFFSIMSRGIAVGKEHPLDALKLYIDFYDELIIEAGRQGIRSAGYSVQECVQHYKDQKQAAYSVFAMAYQVAYDGGPDILPCGRRGVMDGKDMKRWAERYWEASQPAEPSS